MNKKLCVGVIVDGNRRWATERGLMPYEGHAAGRRIFKEFVKWAKEADIGTVIAYAFSTENWNRSKMEVDMLLALLVQVFKEDLEELAREGCRVRVIGERSRFSPEIQELFSQSEERTRENKGLCVVLALSYGGRAEILSAVRTVIATGVAAQEVTEELFSANLFTADIPDPDLIIRTSGEVRLSNFLPWQSVYAELFFVKTLWPDFSKEEFLGILEEFKHRKRRFGK